MFFPTIIERLKAIFDEAQDKIFVDVPGESMLDKIRVNELKPVYTGRLMELDPLLELGIRVNHRARFRARPNYGVSSARVAR
jgi:hypothetical protein